MEESQLISRFFFSPRFPSALDTFLSPYPVRSAFVFHGWHDGLGKIISIALAHARRPHGRGAGVNVPLASSYGYTACSGSPMQVPGSLRRAAAVGWPDGRGPDALELTGTSG